MNEPKEPSIAPRSGPPASPWYRVFPWLSLKWDRILPWIVAIVAIVGVIITAFSTAQRTVASVHDNYRHALMVWESDIRQEIASLREGERAQRDLVFDLLERIVALETEVTKFRATGDQVRQTPTTIPSGPQGTAARID